jgi:SHS2 domain-containing protein
VVLLMHGGWEHFNHQADIGIRGFGPTRELAFAQAALGMIAVITDPKLVEARDRIAITCEAPDDELLLAEWLNALIYEIACRNMLFSRFEVQITDHRLSAEIWGEKVSVARHQPTVEIKGATYTALRVRRGEAGDWMAQCVVDV